LAEEELEEESFTLLTYEYYIDSKSNHEHTIEDITDFAHTHTRNEITDFAHTHTRNEITNFAHTHTISQITDFEHTHSRHQIIDFAHHHNINEIQHLANELLTIHNTANQHQSNIASINSKLVELERWIKVLEDCEDSNSGSFWTWLFGAGNAALTVGSYAWLQSQVKTLTATVATMQGQISALQTQVQRLMNPGSNPGGGDYTGGGNTDPQPGNSLLERMADGWNRVWNFNRAGYNRVAEGASGASDFGGDMVGLLTI
jgi:prefoldin subunit 5